MTPLNEGIDNLTESELYSIRMALRKADTTFHEWASDSIANKIERINNEYTEMKKRLYS